MTAIGPLPGVGLDQVTREGMCTPPGSQSRHAESGSGYLGERNALPGESRCGVCFLAGVWISQLPVSPVRAAEHLPGRYIRPAGRDSHLGAGGRPRCLIPPRPFPSGRARLPATGTPSVAPRSCRMCPAAIPSPRAPRARRSGTWRTSSPRVGSLLSFPLSALVHHKPFTLSRTRGFQMCTGLKLSIPPLPVRGNRFRVHTRDSLAGGGGRASGSAAEPRPLPAASRWGGGRCGAGGGRRGRRRRVRPQRSEGRAREARGGCARARAPGWSMSRT